jgi:hypothetical protein
MNDDLERRLRTELGKGALPVAPDTLRARLAGLPAEPRRSARNQLFTGLRLAGLASAAAVAIAFVLVVRALPGPTGGAPGASLGSAATTGPSATAAATVTPSPSLGLPSSIAASPSIGPSPSVVMDCSTTFVLPATTSKVAPITDVRVGAHPGYDRIVFEFSGSGRPQLTVERKNGPFVQDASGKTVKVPGNTFLSLRLFDASGYPTYTGPSTFSPGYPNLVALVNTGDYEGYVTWIAGLSEVNSICYNVSTLTGPTRIVIDLLDLGPDPS